ncbi:hypothetical protein M1N13_03145 [Dehalococcoidia bacterium]|nr:hypothetical protein [Dehalococcoidia bacterium]
MLSYYLERDVIGSGSLVWGFLTESEAQRGPKWMEELKEAGLPVPEALGMGIYEKVSVIDFKDRQEMRERLAGASPADLLREFSERARRSSACCIPKNWSSVHESNFLPPKIRTHPPFSPCPRRPCGTISISSSGISGNRP